MKRFTLLALTVLAGCAQTPDMYRSLDNANDEARIRKFASCRANATPIIAGGAGLVQMSAHREYIDDCMRADGFVRAK